MQCAIVLGMLASPLQINSKVHHIQKNTYVPDSYIKASPRALSNELIYSYFIQNYNMQDNTLNTDNIAYSNGNISINYDDVLNGVPIFNIDTNGPFDNFTKTMESAQKDKKMEEQSTVDFVERIKEHLGYILYKGEVIKDEKTLIFKENFVTALTKLVS